MPSGYWGGLVEGFQARREAEQKQNYERALQNRQMSDRVYSYLLQSRDPQMQALALSGLMQPVNRKGGFAGFMGEYQEDPFLAQVSSRMNEMVPEDELAHPTLPTPPARPGAAAMSTNQPVRAGSQPIGASLPGRQLPPEPPPLGAAGAGGPGPVAAGGPLGPATPGLPGLGAGGGAPTPPVIDPTQQNVQAAASTLPPPPTDLQMAETKWKRRGTGVPTAEEVAEMQTLIPLQTRINAAVQNLPPEDAQRAISGILGAPTTTRQFTAPGTFGVKITGKDGAEHVVPVSFDVTKGQYFLPDGVTPVPNDAEMVRMTGSSGAAAKRNVVPDKTMPTGYAAVYTDPLDGSELYRVATVYTPPPAYSGAATVLSPSGDATVIGIPRQGVPGGVIGTAVNPQPNTDQASAQALLSVVQQRITAAETPRVPGLPKRPLLPAQLDQIVKEEASKAQLPYTSYFELQQATKVPTSKQVTPQPTKIPRTTPQAPAQSVADKVREQALKNRQGGAAVGGPPAK